MHPDVWHVVTGRPYLLRLMGGGFLRPRTLVPGTDVAGQVVSVGSDVTRWRPGDEVFGETLRGHQWRHGGAYAEYVSVPAGMLARKPANVTFEQAAAVPTSGLIALLNLPDGRIRQGHDVLVNGAAGGVGATAVQLAKARGATVTGVDHPSKLDLVRSLGADRVIDYTREDFTTSSDRYDLIVDVPGDHSFSACRRALKRDGRYVLIGHDHFGTAGRRWLGSVPRFFRLMAVSPFVRQLPKLTPIVDWTFPLDQVPEALDYLMQGEVRGKVVITV